MKNQDLLIVIKNVSKMKILVNRSDLGINTFLQFESFLNNSLRVSHAGIKCALYRSFLINFEADFAVK